MKKMISLAAILSCILGVPAFADSPNDGHRPGQPTVWQSGPDHDGHAPQGGPDAHHQGDCDQCGPDCGGHDKRDQARYEQDHFTWYGNDFRKGYPAPASFRGDEYRVRDWSDRGLPPPPEGHHWSYIDDNYVLIAAAIRIITSVLVSGALGHQMHCSATPGQGKPEPAMAHSRRATGPAQHPASIYNH